MDKPQGEQRHSSLRFVSGAIKDAMLSWSTFEKELFANVFAMVRLDFLAACAIIHINTDKKILMFIFDPLCKQRRVRCT